MPPHGSVGKNCVDEPERLRLEIVLMALE